MSEYPKSFEGLEKKIGYKFKNEQYLIEALTHSSYAHEEKLRHVERRCNERLEFLGDSVLSITASEYLFSNYKDVDEGELTRMRAEIVCERALAGFANEISLGDYLYLGVGEEKNHGRQSKSILSDAFEALLAAIYLDSGEERAETVRNYLLPFLKAELERLKSSGQGNDSKTLLQQFIQQDSSAKLEYVTVSEKGPDHAKTFEVEVKMGNNVIGRGEGRTKKEAEQNAAREALTLFGK